MIKLPTTHYSSRLTRVRESLARKGIDCFLVTDITNVRYLTGFTGSSGLLLIAKKKNIFVTDFRYKEQSEKEIRDCEIMIERKNMVRAIKVLSKKLGIKKLGFESSVSYELFKKLSRRGQRVKAFKGFIEKSRAIKDPLEIDLIREAVRRVEAAFLGVKPYIKQGVSERAIALRLEEGLKKKGCRRSAFDVIVASGPNSAMPHAKPTEKKLNKGDLVIVDWGGEADGYCSDMTRTLLIGKGEEFSKKMEIYQLVLEANKKAITRVRPGLEARDIDRAARDVIRKDGYGGFFGHGTGHGIGLQVHEAPHIARDKKEMIKENMVFTIEPGIYLPTIGGVRIEDMVLVKRDGCEVLTGLSKKLEMIE